MSSLSSEKKVKEGHFRWTEIAKQSKGLARGRNKLGHTEGRKGSHRAGTERAEKNMIDRTGEVGQIVEKFA